MDENKEAKNITLEAESADPNNQNLRINNQQTEKRNMTSYSFVRNNEEANNINTSSSSPIVNEKSHGKNNIQMQSQLGQGYLPQYGQMPPQMMMGFGTPLLGYQNTMMGPPGKIPKPTI